MISRIKVLGLALALSVLFFAVNYGDSIMDGVLQEPDEQPIVAIWFALSFVPFLPMVAAKTTDARPWAAAIAGCSLLSAAWWSSILFGPSTANIGMGIVMLIMPFVIAVVAASLTGRAEDQQAT
ncbi:MAG: hypothetical protein AAFY19_08920 [Pseudomonadota bacterium]